MRYTQRTQESKKRYTPWLKICRAGHRIACCDCSLTHDFQFRTVGKGIEIRARRNNRATAQLRKGSKTTPRIVFGPL